MIKPDNSSHCSIDAESKTRPGIDHQFSMPFLAHLADLRSCIIKALIAIALATFSAYYFSEYIFYFFTLPLRSQPLNAQLIGTSPSEAFMVKLKVSMIVGLLVSSPYCFYQGWLFISPGLLANERTYAFPFVASCTLLFLLGTAFCYWVVLPFAFVFFIGEYQSIGVSATIRITDYLDFIAGMLLVFGTIFELPVLAYFLTKLGILRYDFLLKHTRIIIVAIFVLAAIFTPPDVVTQTLLAVPMMVIYGMCLGVTYSVELSKLKRAEKEQP